MSDLRLHQLLEELVVELRTDRKEREAALRLLIDDRERVRSQVIKVIRRPPPRSPRYDESVRRLSEDRVPLEMTGKIGVQAMNIAPIAGQPGLYRDRHEGYDSFHIINDEDEQIVGVAPEALRFVLATGNPYLVRVRIASNDPDAWDWDDWRAL